MTATRQGSSGSTGQSKKASLPASGVHPLCGVAFAAPEQEARCRQAVEAARQQLQDTPATTERDIEHKRKLRERLKTMVSEKRAQRAPECDIWTEVGRIAVSQ